MSKPLTAASALLFGLLSTACAAPTEVRYVRQAIPPALLECAARPAIPAEATDGNAARLLLSLDDAGEDCRARLRAVRGLVELSTVD